MLSRIRAGTSGFRGGTNGDITVGHAVAIGQSYAQLRRAQHTRLPQIAVGYDQRYGAQVLAEAVASGLAASGADVSVVGCIPTGPFSTYVRYEMSIPNGGGILITGSHMPPDRIGIIPVNPNGTYCTNEVTDVIAADIADFPHSCSTIPANEMGTITTISTDRIVAPYIARLVGAIDADRVREKRYRVLIDPGNGTAGAVAREVLEELGCDVGTLHVEPKQIPDRPSECRAATCGAAIRIVRDVGYDLGACYDGDADRVLFITRDGNALSEDLVGAIFARAVLRGDRRICVTPINSSGLIHVVCRERNATITYCKIGQPDTGRAIKDHRASFAYEASAKYCFCDDFIWYDAIFATVKMLELMAMRDAPLAALASEFPVFHRVDRNIQLSDSERDAAWSRAFPAARETFAAEATRVDDLDGLRFTFVDDAWVMLRPSGTEPLIRVYADAPEAERARSLADRMEHIVRSSIA